MKRFLLLLLPWLCACQRAAEVPDRLIELPGFQSAHVPERTVYVYLPAGYDSTQRHDVLYVHDGQMIFDSTITWNGQEWGVDEAMRRLRAAGAVRRAIVVGVSSIASIRMAEYFPQAVVDSIAEPLRSRMLASQICPQPWADRYLKFLTAELIPYIDTHYATATGPDHTYLMGSSMGGLISLYALCQYPEVFGGAACLSIHSPMVSPHWLSDLHPADNDAAAQFRNYLGRHLPAANSRKIYIDRGDLTLDAHYRMYHDALDSLIRSKGWDSAHYMNRLFPGTDHSERSWAARVDIPLTFLISD